MKESKNKNGTEWRNLRRNEVVTDFGLVRFASFSFLFLLLLSFFSYFSPSDSLPKYHSCQCNFRKEDKVKMKEKKKEKMEDGEEK